MKKLNMILSFALIAIVMGSPVKAHPFEANLESIWRDCNTTAPGQLYNANTSVTLYGDSRIDLIDDMWAGAVPGTGEGVPVPIYGHLGIDGFLGGSENSWNVQNLTHGTWPSGKLLDHLRDCMSSEAGSAKFPNYKTSKNVAFSIGGNDFLANVPVFLFMPWSIPAYADHALNNTEGIIRAFQRKGKESILLIGGYPAVGYSFAHGKNYNYGLNQNPDLPFDMGQHIYPTAAVCPVMDRNTFSKGLFDFVTGVGPAGSVLAGHPLGAYVAWWVVDLTAIGTAPSLGYMFLESAYPEIADRRQIHYAMVWGCMNGKNSEVWVEPQELMRDPVHPDFWGFFQWSIPVLAAFHSLGWDAKPSSSTIARPPDVTGIQIFPSSACNFDDTTGIATCGARWFLGYSFDFTAVDGTPPYTWTYTTTTGLPPGGSITAGSPPINSSVFAGSPTLCANIPFLVDWCWWRFDLKATDSLGKSTTIHVDFGTGL